MALTPNFTVSQLATSLAALIAADTSTGSDAAIINRRIFVQLSDGSYLVPTGTITNYVVWPYINSSITLNMLTKDIAANITVQWLDINNVVLYTKTILFDISGFGETFLYGKIKQMASTPAIINDTNFFENLMKFRVFLDSASQSVVLGNDQFSAQQALDMAASYQLNNAKFF